EILDRHVAAHASGVSIKRWPFESCASFTPLARFVMVSNGPAGGKSARFQTGGPQPTGGAIPPGGASATSQPNAEGHAGSDRGPAALDHLGEQIAQLREFAAYWLMVKLDVL